VETVVKKIYRAYHDTAKTKPETKEEAAANKKKKKTEVFKLHDLVYLCLPAHLLLDLILNEHMSYSYLHSAPRSLLSSSTRAACPTTTCRTSSGTTAVSPPTPPSRI
jgi:hypothetical protein